MYDLKRTTGKSCRFIVTYFYFTANALTPAVVEDARRRLEIIISTSSKWNETLEGSNEQLREEVEVRWIETRKQRDPL